MAEEVAPRIPALERANRRKLTWLRIREQGYYFLLVLPVMLFVVVFFVVPMFFMFLRSFQDGLTGLPVEQEFANETPDGATTTFTVDHAPFADTNGDDVVDKADLKRVLVFRPVDVTSVNPDTGEVVLAGEPTARETIFIVYNDVDPLEPEIGARPGARGNTFNVENAPIRDKNGDGQVTTADVDVQFARELKKSEIIAIDAEAGAITLAEPPAAGQRVAVYYNYSNPTTIFQYDRALGSDFYWDWSFWRPSLFRTTFEIAFFTTLGCLVIGYPVAYLLANVSSRWRPLLLALVIIPFWTGFLVRTFAWKIILGTAGPINDALTATPFVDEPLGLAFNASRLGVYVGLIHLLVPFLILPVFAVMRGIPEHLPKAAESLGATPVRSFLRVYLPLSLPGVAAGSLLVFIISLGFFITPALLGGARDLMVANLIEIQMNQNLNWEFASALGFLLLVITLAFFFFWNRAMSFEQLYGGAAQGATTAEPQEFQNPLMRFSAYIGPYWRNFKSRVGDGISYLRAKWEAIWDAIQDDLRTLPPMATASVSIALGVAIMVFLARWMYDVPWTLVVIFLIGLPVFVGLSLLGARWFRAPLRRVMLSLLVALIFIWMLAPNFIVIPISFTQHPVFLSFPGECCTLENYQVYFGVTGAGHFGSVGQWLPATTTSLNVAILVVMLSVPLGSIAAYGLVRGRFPGKAVLNSLIISPLIVPLIIVAIGVFIFFSQSMDFMLGNFKGITLDLGRLGEIGLPLGFVVAHSLLAIPYVVIIVSAALRGVDETLEQASMSLGASRPTTLRRVVFPQVLPAMIASAFFAFLVSWDELIIALFLSRAEVTTLPKRIWEGIRFDVNPAIAAIATMLVVLTILILAAMMLSQRYFAKRR
ncbi:MAG: ABC transporter permease subunit [Dehalococcoidia bacterium]